MACLMEPIFPDWVDDTDGEDYVNYTTTYVQGSEEVTREVYEPFFGLSKYKS